MLERVWRKGKCWCKCKLIQPLWKTDWRFLKKLGIKLPCNTAVSLLGIYLRKKNLNNTCTLMFTAALFTIARTWEQLRCPSTDEWTKKLWSETSKLTSGWVLNKRGSQGLQTYDITCDTGLIP